MLFHYKKTVSNNSSGLLTRHKRKTDTKVSVSSKVVWVRRFVRSNATEQQGNAAASRNSNGLLTRHKRKTDTKVSVSSKVVWVRRFELPAS